MEGTTEISSIFWLGTTIMLVFASGLIFLALYYQNHFARTKRKEAELMLKVSLESEMKERHRIAADLHDSVCGDLVAIKFYLEHLNKSTVSENSQAINEIKESLDNALENTRLVSYRLMPPLLESMGLCAALQEHFKRLTKRTSIPFTLECRISRTLDATVAYELFHAIQEFNTNMLKYGNIKSCSVDISESADIMSITITDDGIPFSFAGLSENGHGSGLRNISARLKVVNAVLVQNDVPSGNQFTITLTTC